MICPTQTLNPLILLAFLLGHRQKACAASRLSVPEFAKIANILYKKTVNVHQKLTE